LTSTNFARIRFEMVLRFNQKWPLLVFPQMCVKPRKSNVSGFPSPRAARCRRPLRCPLVARRLGPVLDNPRVHPLADEAQDPLVRDPMLKKLLQPAVIQAGEEVADVRLEHPVHPLPRDPDRECIQRIMRAAARAGTRRRSQGSRPRRWR
jgi:hypothetical protein